MAKKNNGKDFLFSDDCGFINGDDEGGESYRYSDGSGYYHGADGSEGYIYSDLTFILLGTNMDLHGVPILVFLILRSIEERKQIREYLSFFVGKRLMYVGESSFDENGNQIGFVMKNPGTYGFDIKKRMYIWGKDAY